MNRLGDGKQAAVQLNWMGCEMGNKQPYSFQDAFKTEGRIRVSLLSTFFSEHFIKFQRVEPYNTTDGGTI